MTEGQYSTRHRAGSSRVGELLALLVLGGLVSLVIDIVAIRLITGWLGLSVVQLLTAAVIAGIVVGIIVVGLVAVRYKGEPWQQLADEGRGGTPAEVVASDGVTLHVESDGVPGAPLTVIFCHEMFLNLTAWREQRKMLAGSRFGLVFYDLRGHGMSGGDKLDEQVPGVRQLARDLASVIASAAPTGNLILVGHGVGGMSILALAAEEPDLFKNRVRGVVLTATSAGPMRKSLTLGLPAIFAPVWPLLRRYSVASLLLLGKFPRPLLRIFGMVPWLIGARYAGLSKSAPRALVRVAASMSYDLPLETAGSFLSAALEHDEQAIAPHFSVVPTVNMIAGKDRFVPGRDQLALRGLLPAAKHVRVPESGHLLPLEHPEVFAEQVRSMIKRVWADSAPVVPAPVVRTPVSPSVVDTEGLLRAPSAQDTNLLQKSRNQPGT